MIGQNSNRNRIVSLLVASILILSALSAINVRVYAVGSVDQQCNTPGGGYLNGIGAYEPAGQSFKPTQTSIVGFSINVWSTNGVDTSMTAKILSGGLGGAPIATFGFTIPTHFGLPSGDWFHFDFPSGVQVTPGSTYALDFFDNTASSGIKWNGCTTAYPGGAGYSGGSYGTPPLDDWSFIEYAGDFSVSLTSSTFSTTQGTPGLAITSVSVTSLNNFNSAVSLSASGAPAGVTTSFASNPVTPSSGGTASSILQITIPGTVASGTYPITITGTSGPLSHSATFTLTVLPAAVPDFTIGSSPATVALNQGASNTAVITVTSVNGFSSAVTLSPSWVGSAPSSVTFGLPSPITPPSGSTATSTLTVNAAPTASTGTFTLRITGTSGSLSHSVDVSIQIAAVTATTSSTTSSGAPPDFTISSSASSISVAQGGSGSSTITITSLNGFSSPVSLSGSWVGTAPADVNYALTSPVTPTSGGTASSPLSITAGSSASTGTFTLRVTGSSGSLTHTVDVSLQINPAATTSTSTSTTPAGPKCLIATATFGSELSPEVQVLRDFRDNSILRTQAGSSFMVAFNAWYYSFSPSVANYLATHWIERTVMKGVLYPLIGILKISSMTFAVASPYPELAALLSGLVAASLIGGLYLGLPLSLLKLRLRRLRNASAQRLVEKLLGIALLGGVAALVAGEALASQPLLTISATAIILSTLFLSSAVTSTRIAERIRKR